jgi:uncharacterized protein YyaL (SSP411 family)
MESKTADNSQHIEAIPAGASSLEVSPHLIEDVLDWLEDEHDPKYGGFGRESKSLDALPLLLLLWSGAWGFRDRSSLAIETLRTAYASPIRDRIEDGFFHFADKRDWSSPHREKLLSDNAWLVQCFLVAHAVSGLSEFATAAWETAGYMDDVLWMPDRGFYGSLQEADDDYYGESVDDRRRRASPPVDRVVYTSWNALAATSKLLLAWQSGKQSHGDRALQVIEGLVDKMIEPRGACNHYWAEGEKPQMTGNLADYAFTSLALGEAYQYTQDSQYLDVMVSLLGFCHANLKAPDGAFHDMTHSDEKPADPAGANYRARYNALLATAYLVAAGLMRHDPYRDTAAAILEALGPTASYNRPAMALATGMLLRPVSVTCDSKDRDLSLWAKTRFLPGLVLQYGEDTRGAVVCTEGGCLAPASSRQQLSDHLSKVYSLRNRVEYLPEFDERLTASLEVERDHARKTGQPAHNA